MWELHYNFCCVLATICTVLTNKLIADTSIMLWKCSYTPSQPTPQLPHKWHWFYCFSFLLRQGLTCSPGYLRAQGHPITVSCVYFDLIVQTYFNLLSPTLNRLHLRLILLVVSVVPGGVLPTIISFYDCTSFLFSVDIWLVSRFGL